MRPLLLIALLAFASRASADPLGELRNGLKVHFLNHAEGAPTAEQALAFPRPGDPQVEELRLVQQAVTEIQLGCARPCNQQEEALLYRGKVELVADGLGLSAQQKSAAIARYLPDGRPRLRGAGVPPPSRPGDKIIEGRVAQAYLSDAALPEKLRTGISARAQSLADALGGLTLIDGNAGGGVAPAGSGASARLTPEQIAQLNAVPRAQAAVLRDLAARPVPSPERPEVEVPEDRLIRRSLAYIDSIGERPDISEATRFAVAMWRTLPAAYEGYERSVETYFQNLADPNVSTLQSVRDGAAVAGNGFLASMSLLPTSAWTAMTRVSGISSLSTRVASAVAESRTGQRISALVERARERIAVLRTGGLTAEEAARAAGIRARAQAGQGVGEADARWFSEHVAGQTEFVWHKTRPADLDLIFTSKNAGRMQARTETYVYGTTKEVNSAWRRALAGSRRGGGDGVNIIFQGQAASLFSRHMPEGFYSSWKFLANQRITNGAGDIIITAWKQDPASGAIMVTGARMATAEEGRFAIQLSTILRHPEVKRAARRFAVDMPITLTAIGEFLVAKTDGEILEMVPGLSPDPAPSR